MNMENDGLCFFVDEKSPAHSISSKPIKYQVQTMFPHVTSCQTTRHSRGNVRDKNVNHQSNSVHESILNV